MRSLEQIVTKWFEDHPGDKDGAIKAFEAYNEKSSHRWPRHPELNWRETKHDAFGHLRHDQCMACGRTRWQVRHDRLSAECSLYKKIDMEGTILSEEKTYLGLLQNSGPIIKKSSRKRGCLATR